MCHVTSNESAGAIYGGEMSAHYRDFAFCDSGMIPWLLIWQLISEEKTRLSELVSEMKNRFPSSGELNFKVSNPANCLKILESVYAADADSIDYLDGLSVTFSNWRFNLRQSNTEPLVRLNVETLGDEYRKGENNRIKKPDKRQ